MTHEQLKCLMVAQLLGPTIFNLCTEFTNVEGKKLPEIVGVDTISVFEELAEKIIQTINEKGKEE